MNFFSISFSLLRSVNGFGQRPGPREGQCQRILNHLTYGQHWQSLENKTKIRTGAISPVAFIFYSSQIQREVH